MGLTWSPVDDIRGGDGADHFSDCCDQLFFQLWRRWILSALCAHAPLTRRAAPMCQLTRVPTHYNGARRRCKKGGGHGRASIMMLQALMPWTFVW